MKNIHSSCLDILTWKDIREAIAQVNSPLAALIDALDPGPEYSLFRVRYPFGTKIVEQGLLHLPEVNGRFMPLQACSDSVRESLSYHAGQPLAILLQNSSAERFISPGIDKVMGNQLFLPGELLFLPALFEPEIMQTPGPFEMTAGARSLFMLASISDRTYFERIKRTFGLHQPRAPQSLWEHWQVFKALTQHPEFSEPWQAEVLFFSKQWIEAIHSDPAWSAVRMYLLECVCQQSFSARNKEILDYVFSKVQETQNLRPDPYLADMAKHIIDIGLGQVPGFAAASRDNLIGPISAFQDIYVELYQLNYAPTLFGPAYFTGQQPVYVSLPYSTSTEFSPRSRQLSRTIDDLREISHILVRYKKALSQNVFQNTPAFLSKFIENVQFDFFHSKPDRFGEIRSTEEMPLEDSNLLISEQPYGPRPFAAHADFARGCVRVAPHNFAQRI